MAKFFIHRPIFATVIALIMILAGVGSVITLPYSAFPHITPPTVQVTATYYGADAETVAETVALPLENAINSVEGMIYMSSSNSAAGQCNITATFEVGYDQDIAAVDVMNAVQSATALLPETVQKQGVVVSKASTMLTMVISLTSADPQYDTLYLSNLAQILCVQPLQRLEGVGQVTVLAAQQYAMRVWLNPDRMAAMGVSADQVSIAIQQQNAQAAIGQSGAEPSVGSPAFTLNFVTLGRLTTVEEFENIVVTTGPDAAVVRVRDVARVELGSLLSNWGASLNGGAVGLLGIYQLPAANALAMSGEVRKEMARLKALMPPGIDIQFTYDASQFVTESLNDLFKTLIEAAVLVLVVIFIFLQDWRATMIPMIAIPVAIVGTFAGMAMMGFSVNTLTLLGLVLAIGLVVDDSIVVVENVYRQLELGAPNARVAAERAMQEVTAPIVATSLVLLAVFVPASLMPGITGQLYNQFALTIALSISLSAINSLTLSPALCGIFLKKPHHATWKPFVVFNRGFDAMRDSYANLVEWLAKHWYVIATAFVAGVISVSWLFMRTSTAFLPNEDQGYYYVLYQLAPGASIGRTRAAASEIREIVMRDSAVANFVEVSGMNQLLGGPDTASGFAVVVLKPWDERNARTENLRAILERAMPQLWKISEAAVMAAPPPPISGLGAVAGWQAQLEDINGAGFDDLAQVAVQFEAALIKRPELSRVNSPFQGEVPMVEVDFDRTKLSLLGLKISDVYSALGATMGQAFVNNFNEFRQVLNVMVEASPEARMRVVDLLRIRLKNKDGEMVPMAAIATVRIGTGVSNAPHYNAYNTVPVYGAPAPGYSSGDAITALNQVAKQVLPEGYAVEWTGTTYQEIEAAGYAPIVFGLSLVAVFLLLAALYESWALPFNVMFAVVFAVLGALCMLHLRSRPMDTYSQIGLVMLVGLSAKNAILIVEFAKSRLEGGEGIIQAAVESSRIRLRPILMTSVAFILGIFPLFIAIGAGAQSRRSIGTVVLGGMLGAVVVDQLVVPVLFTMVERLRAAVLGEKALRKPHDAA